MNSQHDELRTMIQNNGFAIVARSIQHRNEVRGYFAYTITRPDLILSRRDVLVSASDPKTARILAFIAYHTLLDVSPAQCTNGIILHPVPSHNVVLKFGIAPITEDQRKDICHSQDILYPLRGCTPSVVHAEFTRGDRQVIHNNTTFTGRKITMENIFVVNGISHIDEHVGRILDAMGKILTNNTINIFC